MSESGIPSDRQKISRIVAELLDIEHLSKDDFTWLEQRLREDDGALSEYLKLVDLDARLRWANRSGWTRTPATTQTSLKSAISAALAASGSPHDQLDSAGQRGIDCAVDSNKQQPARDSLEQSVANKRTVAGPQAKANRSTLDGREGPKKTGWWIAGAVAVAVLLLMSTQHGSQHGTEGTLVQAAGAIWSGARGQIAIGETLGKGRQTLLEGVVEITVTDDTQLIVEGPATFELVSTNTVRLERGNLSLFVGPQTTGFTVETPDARVVDLSTAFQVNVGRNGTEVHVIEGEVVASGTYGPADQRANKLHLFYRDAVAFHRRDGKVEPVDFVGEQLKFHGDAPLGAIPRKVSGDIRCLPHPPTSVVVGEFEHDDQMYLFLEQSDALIEKTIYADRSASGEIAAEVGNLNMQIAAGTRVNSYLLHFDPKVNSVDAPMNRVSGTVTFRTPILGVFTRNVSLKESDRQLSSSDTTYARVDIGQRRALDLKDFVSFSPDRKTLIANFQANTSADQIRIVTMSEYP